MNKQVKEKKPRERKPREKKESTEMVVHSQETPAVVERSIIEKPKTLSLANPEQVMAFGKVLKRFITENKLSTQIGSSNYAHVDGWKFAGMNFGLTAIPYQPTIKHMRGEYVHILYSMVEFTGKQNKKYTKEVAVFVGYADHQEIIKEVAGRIKVSRELVIPHFSYECQCDIVSMIDKSKVSFGVGLCSNLELTKSGFQEYAINSMAQTRSIGKGFRNLLGFVMNAADHESTPAEEMDEINREMEMARTTPAEPKPKEGKPFPNEKQFAQILTRVINGKFDRKKAEDVFTFTKDQENAIKIAQDARKQHQPAQP